MQSQFGAASSRVDEILRKNEVVFAGLFGSRAKGDAIHTSDYDFLIQFHPQKKYTLLHLVGLKRDLESALQKPVDVVTPNGLDRYIKQEVMKTMVPIYENR